MRVLAILLGLVLAGTGAVVLRMLPKVSASQRPLLRGIAFAQLTLGVIAVVLAALGFVG
jgi:hypothetical protein